MRQPHFTNKYCINKLTNANQNHFLSKFLCIFQKLGKANISKRMLQ